MRCMRGEDWLFPMLLVLVIVGEIAGLAWVLSADQASLATRSWALIVLAAVAGVVWLVSEGRRRRGRGRWQP
ncbi:MAG: hypothetical protein U5K73_00195 [Halofilum sp. (in: g-proteobacteria)]|nr:hypothetical protein [Halofilum sp. (in: g-proteobacteria)]